MARDGSGTYNRAVADYVYDTVISETDVNTEMDDIATALTGSVAKDGQTALTGSLNMNSNKITSLTAGTARTDAANVGQAQDGTLNWVDGGGTADAITATYSPAITALVDGQICCVRATAANATTTPTFAPNGLTAHTIVKTGGDALAAGDIAGDGHDLLLRYDLPNTQWELMNPAAVNGLSNVVEDTTPQLGGDLDLNGNDITGMVIGTDIQAYDADTLFADTADVLTKGFAATPYNAGTQSSGTYTPDEANGNLQYAVNGGAHTLAPPTNNCSIVIQYTNNASAGTITTSGFTKVTGAFSTTDGDDFMLYITKLNGFSHLFVQALQ